MIILLNGYIKTPHPFSIEPQEPSVDLILNACRDWVYDESTHIFKYINFNTGKPDEKCNLCLDDYSFETNLFRIILVPGYGRSNKLWQLRVQPIHPNANVTTVESEFFVTEDEAEALSKDPTNIPSIICNTFCKTEPFDQSIVEILSKKHVSRYWTRDIPRPVNYGTPVYMDAEHRISDYSPIIENDDE